MIIIALLSRWCWNWQTGMVEGHVTKVVEVQVLSSAQSRFRGFFYFRNLYRECIFKDRRYWKNWQGVTMTVQSEKIISITKMRKVEMLADQHGLSFANMMENAASGLADVIRREAGKDRDHPFILGIAGKGNNGGDCLLSLTLLAAEGYLTGAFCYGRDVQNDHLVLNAKSAGVHVMGVETFAMREWFKATTSHNIILVDGLLGTGFSGELNQEARQILTTLKDHLNRYVSKVIAVDCPSGTNCDTGEVSLETLRADITVCMAAVKGGLLKPPANAYSGSLEVVSIGLDTVLPGWSDQLDNIITEKYAAGLLPIRSADAHKGSFGKALVAGGSGRYPGALSLCLQAAARTGVGLVTGASAKLVKDTIACHLPDVTWIPLEGNSESQLNSQAATSLGMNLAKYTALACGPGLGVSPDTMSFMDYTLHELQTQADIPIILDADSLKCLSEIPEWWQRISCNAILTPHPGEMKRLTGLSEDEILDNRIGITRRFAVLWNKVVVLKGAFSVISTPLGQVWVSPYATSALSHPGSGDVLTGIILGYLAQKLDVTQAAILGVTIHAISAILASKNIGCDDSVLASDLIRYIPNAIAKLRAI